MQGGDERHLQSAKQFQNVRPCGSAKNSVLVLQADQVDIAEIQEVSGLSVGRKIVLGKFEANSARVKVTFFSVVYRERQEFRGAIFLVNGVTQIGGECGDATAARKIVAHDSDAIGKRGAARLAGGMLVFRLAAMA